MAGRKKKEPRKATPVARCQCPCCDRIQSLIVYRSFERGVLYAHCPPCKAKILGHDATLMLMRKSERKGFLFRDEVVLPYDVYLDQLKRLMQA